MLFTRGARQSRHRLCLGFARSAAAFAMLIGSRGLGVNHLTVCRQARQALQPEPSRSGKRPLVWALSRFAQRYFCIETDAICMHARASGKQRRSYARLRLRPSPGGPCNPPSWHALERVLALAIIHALKARLATPGSDTDTQGGVEAEGSRGADALAKHKFALQLINLIHVQAQSPADPRGAPQPVFLPAEH